MDFEGFRMGVKMLWSFDDVFISLGREEDVFMFSLWLDVVFDLFFFFWKYKYCVFFIWILIMEFLLVV